MTLHLLPCGHWAADIRLNVGELQTTFRVISARRVWAMQMAIAKANKILEQLK